MYFGPNEEEAVVKFLESRHIETVNLTTNKKVTIHHNLGKNILVNAFYIIQNDNAYSKDNKFITIDIDVNLINLTDESVDITTD
jgi:hypothetical protein